MDGGSVTMDDYGQTGFGAEYGQLDLDREVEIAKALLPDGSLPRTGPGPNALGMEDLSPTLKSVEIQESQLRGWKLTPKAPAYSLVVEGSTLTDLGNNFGASGFIGSVDPGTVADPLFRRPTAVIKYLAEKAQWGVPGEVANMMGFNGRGQNLAQTAKEVALRRLLRNAERNLFFGDSRVSPLEWDGYGRQIDNAATLSNNLRIDLQGAPPDKLMLEKGAEVAHHNSAEFSVAMLPHEGMRDLQESLFPEARTPEGYGGDIGVRFRQYVTEKLGGDPDRMKIERVHMLSFDVKGGIPNKVPSTVAPNPPAVVSSVTGSGNSSFTTTTDHPGLAAGTNYYTIVPVGPGGWNSGTMSGGIACSAGQQITLTIVETDPSTSFFYVFRNPAGVSGAVQANHRFLARIPYLGPTTQWSDDGHAVPDTYQGYCLSFQNKETQIHQLLPPQSRPLPNALMLSQAGVLCFATLLMEAVEHNLHFVNIGRRPQPGTASLA